VERPVKGFVSLMILLFIVLPIIGQSYHSVFLPPLEGDVEVRVDTTYGYFGIGQYSTGENLTYEFSDPYSRANSNFNLKFDGSSVYSWPMAYGCAGEELSDYFPDEYPVVLGATNTIQNKWNISLGGDLIVVNQFFTPVDLYGDSLGLIKVRYQIQNNGSVSHSVELEHKWDIMINTEDDAPVAIPGAFSTDNRAFDVPPMPGTFQAWEEGFFFGPAQLVGRGVVNSFDATSPVFFAYGDEIDLIPSCFTIDGSWPSGDYDFTAALLRWGPVTIPPGASWEIVTYYGLGKADVDVPDMALTLLNPGDWAADTCEIVGNPKQFQFIVGNNSSGITTFDSTWLCISYDAALCTLDTTGIFENDTCISWNDIPTGETRTVTWAFSTRPFVFGEFEVTAHCETNEPGVSPIDTTYSFSIPEIDGRPPIITFLEPSWPFTACTSGSGLEVWIEFEDSAGVNDGETEVTICTPGTTLCIDLTADSAFIWDTLNTDHKIDTLFIPLDMLHDLTYGTGDTVKVCVTVAEDSNGCLPRIDPPICYDIVVDQEPPIIFSTLPLPGSSTILSTPTITIGLRDLISGVDTSKIYYSINGTPYHVGTSTEAAWNAASENVIHSPASFFLSERWVEVCVDSVADMTDGFCGPNWFRDSCWNFFVDYTGPDVELIRPLPNSIVSCETLTIIIATTDSSCFNREAGTITFTPGAMCDLSDPASPCSVSWACDTLYIHDVAFSEGPVNMTIDLMEDSLGNTGLSIIETFKIDTTGPQPDLLTLAPMDMSYVSPAFACSLILREESGINDTSVTMRFTVDGTDYDYQVGYDLNIALNPGSSAEEKWVVYNNALGGFTVSHGDTIQCCLIRADDIATLCGSNPLIGAPICWEYYVDAFGPEVELVWPADSSISACWPIPDFLKFIISDDIGVDESSVLFDVDGNSLSGYFLGDTFYASFAGSETLDVCPDEVNIELIQAMDFLGNITAGRRWSFTVDTTAPSSDPATWYPGPSSVVSPFDTIRFAVNPGCIGEFSRTNTIVNVWNKTLGRIDTIRGDSPLCDWAPDSTDTMWTMQITDIPYVDDGDTICIRIFQLRDSLDYMYECPPSEVVDYMGWEEWCFRVSAGGPIITRIQPERHFVSCDTPTFIYRVRDNDGIRPTSTQFKVRTELSAVPIDIPWDPAIMDTTSVGDSTEMIITLDLDISDYVDPCESLYVTFDYIEDLLFIGNDAPSSWWVRVDTTNPIALDWGPLDTITTRTPLIWALIKHDCGPIEPDSLAFSLDGGFSWIWRTDSSGAVYWSSMGDTAFLNISRLPDSLWPVGGDDIMVCVKNTDATDTAASCELNKASQCWTFTVESGGPIANPVAPGEYWYWECPSVDSLIIALEDHNGIDTMSVEIACTSRVSGVGYYYTEPSGNLHHRPETLIVIPDVPFADEDTIDVSLWASDVLLNTLAGGEPYTYRFIIDHTPPDSIWTSPNCHDDSTTSPSPLIWLKGNDQWGVIDSIGWCVEFLHPDTIAGDYWDSVCYFDAETAWVFDNWPDSVGLNTRLVPYLYDWEGGDTIVFHVFEVCDYSDTCGPNCTNWPDTCRIPIASRGPLVTNVWPGGNGVIGCVQPDTFIFALDDGEGIDTSSLVLHYASCLTDTIDFTLADDSVITYYTVGPNTDTLHFVPPEVLPEGCYFSVSIEAFDGIGNEEVPNEFEFVYDYTPPGFVIYEPLDSAYSFNPEIILGFPDNFAGVDTGSVTVSVTSWCGTPFDVISPAPDTLSWYENSMGIPETLILSFDSLESCLVTGDTVCINVSLTDICDNSADCAPCTTIDSSWCFVIAQGGPLASIEHPPTISPHVCPEDSIVIWIDDMDGVFVDSLHFWINGTDLTYPYALLDWDGTSRLGYKPSSPFTESYLNISVWGAYDGMGYFMDSTSWELRVDLDPPVPEYISPVGTIGSHQPNIRIAVHDSLNPITLDCFELWVDDTTYTFDDSILSWIADSALTLGITDAGTLVWNAILAADTLLAGDTIDVCLVRACDSTSCASNNISDSICWSFNISVGDGPILSIVDPPACGMSISCDTLYDSLFHFQWLAVDSPGVADYSILLEFNNGLDIDTFDISDIELSTAPGIGSSLYVIFDPIVPSIPGEIWVRFIQFNDLLGNPAFGASDTCFFTIDWDEPYIGDYYPADGSEISVSRPILWWLVNDDSSPLNHNSGIVIIQGETFTVDSSEVWWNGDTIFFQPSVPFTGGDSIAFCLTDVEDSVALCAPNLLDTVCHVFTINAEGPVVEPIIPDDAIDPSFTFCDSGAFWLLTMDVEGLLTDSVIVLWNDIDTIDWLSTPELFELRAGTADTDTVLVGYPQTYANGDTICLELLHWTDNLWNPAFGTNRWCAIVDLEAPDTTFVSPGIDEYTSTWSPQILAHLIDSLAWVDHSSVILEIYQNSSLWGSFEITDPELSWGSDDTLIFDSDSNFIEFAEICPILTILDSTTVGEPYNCPANENIIEWCFNIGDDDTIGPEMIIADGCTIRANLDSFAIMVAMSDINGLYDDTTTIDTTGQGLIAHFFGDVEYWLPMEIIAEEESIGVPGDTMYWLATSPGAIPASEIQSGMVLCYQIYARDNDFDFSNPIDRQLAITDTLCCTVYNDVPPTIEVTVAPENNYVSCICDTLQFLLIDQDDIITDSLVVEINGVPYTTDSSGVNWQPHYPDSAHVFSYGRDDNCWSHSDTIEVCVRNAMDQWFNVMDDSCWSYYVDLVPPVAWCMEETDTNVDIEDFETIELFLDDDDAGVNPSEIEIEITQITGTGGTNIITIPITSPELTYNATTGALVLDLRYTTGLTVDRNDSLFISMVHAEDLSRICEPNAISDEYLCVKYVKPITRCHASPQPFTPPPPADGYNDEVIFDYPGRIDTDALVKIYDMRGRLIDEIGPTGPHYYTWDGEDLNGVPVRPGVYLYVIEQGGEVICSGTVVLAR